MGLLRLELVSECRITKNTTNDTTQTFFNILRIEVEYLMTTITTADIKLKNCLLILKVVSTPS